MEIFAWFGRIDQEAKSFVPLGDEREMIEALLSPRPLPSAQPDLRALARSYGKASSDSEYNSLLREAALRLVRSQLEAQATAEQDLLQAAEALDDLFQAVNLLDERLYEWSRLHRQEIERGADLARALCEDEIMGELARAVLSLHRSREALEKEVGSAAEEIAPNLSRLAGPVLAARLISRAGSLRRLAEMPSSAIQVMGAEKSLFKHLKGRAPSPKHGIIYRHPAVIGAPRTLRGRVSRVLAGKLAIASRLDYHGAGLSPDLEEALTRRLAEVRSIGRRSGRDKS